MRLSEEDKKCIKILYRNGLNVKEIEKLLNNEFSKDAIQKHIYWVASMAINLRRHKILI
ncbi:hypothetical protein [Clostridium perfringens]|uniref:hypothetical protein n=1 Tax=Clostridium perfringens TaxID=1502 RepID=UPI003A100CE6